MASIDPIEEDQEQVNDPGESLEAQDSPESNDNEEGVAEGGIARENIAVPAIPEKH